MKSLFRLIIFLLMLFVINSSLSAKSVWDVFNLYEKTIYTGDFIYIIFTEETMINYEMKQKLDSFQSIDGIEYSGEVFDFFPESSVSEDDSLSRDHQWQMSMENEAMITTRVDNVSGDVLTLSGETYSMIGGDLFTVSISGECDKNSISPQRTVESGYLYDLRFTISSGSDADIPLVTEENLIYETNFSDIFTNLQINNGITNQFIETNYSSITIDLAGIDDNTKKEMIIQYLNNIVDVLFE